MTAKKSPDTSLTRFRALERQVDEAQNKINSLSAERIKVEDLRKRWTEALDFLEHQIKDISDEGRRALDAVRVRVSALEASGLPDGIETRIRASENLVKSLSVSVEAVRTQKQKAARGEINALIDRLEKCEGRFSQSHDSLAFHCNQLSAQVVALQEDVQALEMYRERPWWRRIFKRTT